jgi:acyl carrier protein
MARRVVISVSLPPELADEVKQHGNISEYIRSLLTQQGQKNNSITEERVIEIIKSYLGNKPIINQDVVVDIGFDPLAALNSLAK